MTMVHGNWKFVYVYFVLFFHFHYLQSIVNISAGKIVKKYRRSTKSIGFARLSSITGTEESIINYDAFEVRLLLIRCSAISSLLIIIFLLIPE